MNVWFGRAFTTAAIKYKIRFTNLDKHIKIPIGLLNIGGCLINIM